MKLFVGLGNPGAKYAGNRHNIGFMAVDRIALDHGFGAWRAKHRGETSEGTLGGEKVVLLKPGTFMNLSGQSVGEAMRFYKLAPADITVFHDELDLAPGRVRFKAGGGHAGHNGLRSLHQHIGDAYGRVRLGIGHPGHRDAVSPYVLSDFTRAERDLLDDVLRGLSDGAPALAAGDPTRFMNAVALRVAPARDAAGEPGGRGAGAAGTGPADAGAAGGGAPGGILRALLERFRP
ncbi:MAG: aminoacyl-tRNA hydrolase [Pseudomonadota bacterium]